jgi:hypothetical protein
LLKVYFPSLPVVALWPLAATAAPETFAPEAASVTVPDSVIAVGGVGVGVGVGLGVVLVESELHDTASATAAVAAAVHMSEARRRRSTCPPV